MSHLQMFSPEDVSCATVPFADIESNLLAVLYEHGYAIVTDVLAPNETAQCEALFATDLRNVVNLDDENFLKTPMATNTIRSWPLGDANFALGRRFGSFAADYGLPQGQCAWFCRLHPNVQAVYRTIFSTDSLVCGTDNVFFDNRVEAVPEPERYNRCWPHADQSTHIPVSGEWDSYQSVVYIWPAGRDTSATVIWPGSHLQPYQNLMKLNRFSQHFCPLTNHTDFKAKSGRVPVPPGAMLVWNSKTIHQGWDGGPRLAVPVCFEPRKRRDLAAYKRKRECVKSGLATTHWASLGLPHSSSNVRPGGSGEVPLFAGAHRWLLVNALNDDEDGILPQVAALL